MCIAVSFKLRDRTPQSLSADEWTKKPQDVCRVLYIVYIKNIV